VIVPAAEDLAAVVDAIGRFGGVTTSVVLRSEPPKAIHRTLLAAGRKRQPVFRPT
jgi:Lrp/AsnC family leucine-responsive transcriptional regulator